MIEIIVNIIIISTLYMLVEYLISMIRVCGIVNSDDGFTHKEIVIANGMYYIRPNPAKSRVEDDIFSEWDEEFYKTCKISPDDGEIVLRKM